jgi:hypothetical protein
MLDEYFKIVRAISCLSENMGTKTVIKPKYKVNIIDIT